MIIILFPTLQSMARSGTITWPSSSWNGFTATRSACFPGNVAFISTAVLLSSFLHVFNIQQFPNEWVTERWWIKASKRLRGWLLDVCAWSFCGLLQSLEHQWSILSTQPHAALIVCGQWLCLEEKMGEYPTGFDGSWNENCLWMEEYLEGVSALNYNENARAFQRAYVKRWEVTKV